MKRTYKLFIIFHLSRGEGVIKGFVENASKQKTVDTAKLKKINNNH